MTSSVCAIGVLGWLPAVEGGELGSFPTIAFAALIVKAVDGDPSDPRRGRVVPTDPPPPDVGAHKGVLDRLVDLGIVAERGAQRRGDGPVVRFEEVIEVSDVRAPFRTSSDEGDQVPTPTETCSGSR
jgi:hypothetical protein